MAKTHEVYICSSCGGRSSQWKGQCPACREWNTLEARVEARAGQSAASGRTGRAAGSGRIGTSSLREAQSRPIALSDVSEHGHEPYGTGLDAFDRVLGNGFVPGAALLMGGEPGIGKSTLLLQVAGAVAASGKTALYLSGEESLPQIRGRAERLGVLHPNLLAVATSRVEDILPVLEQAAPSLLIVDSVQTLTSDMAEGLPGNVSQVRAVGTELVEACKRADTTLVLVGHVTKDGTLAGPRLLEHLVDVVIALEGDRRQMFRLLRVLKNRYGPNEELLVFRMVQRGLEVVDDPATFFLGARDATLSGAAVVMAVDGQRPLAVELQALVTRSYLAIPRRTGLGFDTNRLHLLLAVLEKRLRLNFGQVDIYAKVGGGMKLTDPGMDLALVAAVLSSFYDIPLPERAVLWGEVDLNGQIRPAHGHTIRLAQARRLGYEPILHPEQDKGGVATVTDLQNRLFRKGVAAGRGKGQGGSASTVHTEGLRLPDPPVGD